MRLTTIVVLSITAASVALLNAKAPTRKIIIDGADLAGLVEIVDGGTLALGDVYRGNFLDTTRGPAAAPRGLPEYDVSFYLEDDRGSVLARAFRRRRLYRAYVVELVLDSARHAGYVYVPGSTDTWAPWNRDVIIRPKAEGHWNYTSTAWTQRIGEALAHARRRPAPACPASHGASVIGLADSMHADVAEVKTLLEAHDIRVLCAYQTTMDGMLGQRAAAFMTDLGPVGVLFFSAPRGAESVTMASSVKDGQVLTVLRGPSRVRPIESVYSADKTDFLAYKRWLFDTFGQKPLRSALGRIDGR